MSFNEGNNEINQLGKDVEKLQEKVEIMGAHIKMQAEEQNQMNLKLDMILNVSIER